MRNKLLLIANNPENDLVITNGKFLSDVAFVFLLVLAEDFPLNPAEDYELVENKVYVSTGHQYDINELIGWHNARPSNRELGDIGSSQKSLWNYMTSTPFSEKDVAHIHKVASEKGIEISGLLLPQVQVPVDG